LPPNPVETGAAENEFAGGPEPNGVGAPNEGALGVNGFGAIGGVDDGGGADLEAASIAFALKSLSSPANIIPDNVPVKNVAIGTINSKNFWSIGEIALSGCVTKIREYNTTKTIPFNVNAK